MEGTTLVLGPGQRRIPPPPTGSTLLVGSLTHDRIRGAIDGSQLLLENGCRPVGGLVEGGRPVAQADNNAHVHAGPTVSEGQ